MILSEMKTLAGLDVQRIFGQSTVMFKAETHAFLS